MKNILIEKYDHFGRGIIKDNEKIIFVPDAVVGDVLDVDIVKMKKNVGEARINRIVKPSNCRIKSPCPYSGLCGGCSLLNINYTNSLIFKEDRLREIISKFSGINVNINSIVASNPFNYRNKITLHIKGNKLGLYKYNSKELIEIDKCLLVDKKINEIIEKIRVFIKDNSNNLNEVVIRSFDNNDLICFKGSVDKEVLKSFFKMSHSLWLNDELLVGESNLVVDFLNYKFVLSKDAFFQVNLEIAAKMFKYIKDFVKEKNYRNVLDLYCGVGVIGIVVSCFVDSVVGIEKEKSAVVNANINKKLNNIDNISFIAGKVEDYIDKFKNYDLVIIDPPRSGLDRKTINNILRLKSKDIIYVSCDASTLARDLKILSEFYNVVEVTPFDMFPNTYHSESVTILERK